MKILHSALLKNCSAGIVEQMYAELKSAQDLDIDLEVKIFIPKQEIEEKYKDIFEMYNPNKFRKVSNWIEHRIEYYKWLKQRENEIDCFILRYSVGDPLQYIFLKNSKKPVYLIHHTKELEEMYIYGFKGLILKNIDKIFGTLSIKKSAAIIGVTNEIIEYEKLRIKDTTKKSILYPNGIDMEVIETLIKDKREYETPEILFVASYFYEWHGLDLLIDSFKDLKIQIVVHIVGNVPEELLNKLNENKIFKYHGSLDQNEIKILAEKCWVGLGSFALHRKNMKEACTLKVREYLSMGLGVYSGHKDVFPKEFIFYKESEFIEINKLLDYCYEIRNFSKNDIIDSSKKYISKKELVHDFINNIKLFS